jgi:hypothetical protein
MPVPPSTGLYHRYCRIFFPANMHILLLFVAVSAWRFSNEYIAYQYPHLYITKRYCNVADVLYVVLGWGGGEGIPDFP